MPNVYLVRQDTSHLYGEFLISAVVVADSVHQAKEYVRVAAQDYMSDDGAELGFYPGLIMVEKIGNNGKFGQRNIICWQLGENIALPTGNYTPHKRNSNGCFDEDSNFKRWKNKGNNRWTNSN